MNSWRRANNIADVPSDNDRNIVLALERPSSSPQALEGPASIIWRHTPAHDEPPATSADITRAVAASTKVDADVIRGDVEAFLRQLHELGLIVVSSTRSEV